MFRKWLSGYLRNNKEKIKSFLKICLIVAIIIYVVYMIFNSMKDNNEQETKEIYKPQETVILGDNLKQEKYEEDCEIIDNFIQYCNNGNSNEAYKLLTEECKKNLYPNINDFTNKYINKYFSEKREYSLQSWVNNGNYVTYQIRIIDDIISTGNYDQSEKYQDYITIVEKGDSKKININGYIKEEYIDKVTEKDGIKIEVCEVNKYMDYEEYVLRIINNTDKTILLDNMKQSKNTLNLVSSDNIYYSVRTNSISYTKLTVEANETKNIKIQFDKKYTTDTTSKYIVFSKVVKDYVDFMNNQISYNSFIEIKTEL